MKIRPSVKRMRVDEWRPWQREEYLGVHTGFVPAEGACMSYQYRPVSTVQAIPVMARAPQAEYWLQKADDRSVWQMFKEWLKK